MGLRYNLTREDFAQQAGRCARAKLLLDDGDSIERTEIFSWLLRERGGHPGQILRRNTAGVEGLLQASVAAMAAQLWLIGLCKNHGRRMA